MVAVVEVNERELDKQIAQKFFDYPSVYEEGISQTEYESRRKQYYPFYSDDLELAWSIVERIRKKGKYKIEISSYPGEDLWTIKAYHRDGYAKSCTTSAKTLPLAICLAAMKAQ